MKNILNLLLIAGALTLIPGLSATAKQSRPSTAQPQASADPQAKVPPQASTHSPHPRKHSNTTRHRRHHKTSSKR